MAQQNAELVPGAVVETNDGRLGLIDRVDEKKGRKKPSGVYVWLGQSEQPTLIPLDEIKSVRSAEEVNRRETHLLPVEEGNLASGTAATTVPTDMGSGVTGQNPSSLATDTSTMMERNGEILIPIASERLNIAKRVVDLGELRIHKKVEQIEEVQSVSVTHDELVVERIPMNQPLDAPLQPRTENDVLIIPIMKEVLVVQRQLVLVEEVRVSKRYVTEEHEVREPVRRERVELEDATVHDVSGTAVANANMVNTQ